MRFCISLAALGIFIALIEIALAPVVKNDNVQLPARGICAHRGASHTHPENTLAAIDEAVRLGAQQIEIDVRRTTDGHLVLMHDGTVTRTTDAAEKFPGKASYQVTDFTLAELQTLDAGRWKDTRFAGEKIPTLKAAIARMPRNVWINLDVKGNAACTTQLADEIIALRRTHQAIFSVRKGEMTAIQDYMRKHDVNLIINNMNRRPTPAQYIAETIEAGHEFIQLIGDAEPVPQEIEKLKQAGVRINRCCTNDADQLRSWFAAGIDFPLVDDVALGVRVARELGIEGVEPTEPIGME